MSVAQEAKSGEGGRGLEPASSGYLQYAVFALRRQEESEDTARITVHYAGTFTLPATFRENLASSDILVGDDWVSLRRQRLPALSG
jgi:hypothetical protein